jgi:hypothetical protein
LNYEEAVERLHHLLGAITYVRYTVKGIRESDNADPDKRADIRFDIANFFGMSGDFGTATVEERVARNEKKAFHEISGLPDDVFAKSLILEEDAPLHIEATWASYRWVVAIYPQFRVGKN